MNQLLTVQSDKPYTPRPSGKESNRLHSQDTPFHDWYRFVLSFPPHLVRDYLEKFQIDSGHQVLDPFSGTGTTVVECKKRGIPSVGVEANVMAWFAGEVKVDWTPDPDKLLADSRTVAEAALEVLKKEGIEDEQMFGQGYTDASMYQLRTLPPDILKLLLTDSISPLPLHKVLVLSECQEKYGKPEFRRHQKLALAKELVTSIGNLHFGPEVGVGKKKSDAPVVAAWLDRIHVMCQDLRSVEDSGIPAKIYHADSRNLVGLLDPCLIDAVITSPPYPNEKDYTRTTRLESVLLEFITSKEELRELKKGLVRSNTRGVYKDDTDDKWVTENPEIQRIATAIEDRRIELGKTSGFEKLYGRVTKLYFGGMTRHLAELRPILRPGAQLAYVVGDQASYLRVMIRTGEILADIATSLGYEVERIDLFRTRIATATKEQLREEVVILKWKG
jgi:DNA modification methylase